MRPTAALCREQESLQRIKAANAPLENSRKIARGAAEAWAAEAILAEQRDSKQTPLDRLDTEIREEFAREAKADGVG